ncbi:CofH family radical SAM protein [Pyrobaculum neutrophilum]|uniref:Radical SAM domain protein n=1 Tax=Pyrobaculum neutrophilum (strain DSM 2338 / JCM 9278 / NBRC 100436 / V24Sta) TaxID=444157 RepID=B1YAU8_PYRNV|nr:CofH family radical SAM protein [Pyrobaculum neutrophilum]ACB39177.1 Radical SAM domain protein [Pyrobaculum neutrophilum V24Sta]
MTARGLSRNDAVYLMREVDLFTLAEAAHAVTQKFYGDVVTFVNNVVINYTNICVAKCPICAFYRSPGHPEAYTRKAEEVAALVERFAVEYGVTELHINGGFNPLLPPEYFDELFKAVKRRVPHVVVKGPTMAEAAYYAGLWKMSVREVLSRWKEAGLDAISGGGAEIFADEVRKVVAPHKISGEEWLRVAEVAHELGIPSNATVLYGHVEAVEHLVDHIFRVRELQEKTGGLLLFIPVKFNPLNTELHRRGVVKAPAPSTYDVKVVALARLILLDRLKVAAYWLSVGKKLASTLLLAGANDLVGTMYNEAVLTSAGAKHSATVEELAAIAREAGKTPALRDTFHRRIKPLDGP